MPAILPGDSLKRLLQGAAVGAVATMVIGFYWGGWVLGSTAANNTARAVETAQVQFYLPTCVDRFQTQAGADAKWAELKALSYDWERSNYIQKNGYATPAGAKEPNSKIAAACASALGEMAKKMPVAAK